MKTGGEAGLRLRALWRLRSDERRCRGVSASDWEGVRVRVFVGLMGGWDALLMLSEFSV